ncbi:MAG: type II toxin-antitoxin system prevent-host-death family antitoxin [Candidatus Eremiobacteraeota bacterium]|nr:type II toxin-antitoxin system prevent-host-death family antitoxin [Candidatus Eremiobacteraeota bacterium]
MKTVGAFEGKTHFSALINEAERGETIVITKNGRPVAQLGPVQAATQADDLDRVVERILARKIRVGIPSKELIEEGRRH